MYRVVYDDVLYGGIDVRVVVVVVGIDVCMLMVVLVRYTLMVLLNTHCVN